MTLRGQWEIFRQDLAYAVRTLLRARAFTLTVILVAAIGVGANTAAFSVADFVLLRPLPFPDPDALVRLCEGPRGGGGWGCMNQLSPANYRDLARMNTALQGIGAFANDAVNLVGGREPRRLAIARLTPDVLPVLGVSPLTGRVFIDKMDVNAAVLSYGLWQSQFAGDPAILGRTVNLNGVPYTVIGVMPAGFYFPIREVQLWTELTLREADFANRGNNYLEAVGRLRPGVTFEQARAELSAIADRLARDYPDTNEDTGVSFFRMRDNLSPRSRLTLISLSAASLCLLLLTCANLANLLLARATAHARELAVRAALGATRQRLVRQMITQTIVLTALGGIAGVLLAAAIVPLFANLVPQTLPIAEQPRLDMRVFMMAAVITALTALMFGVLPALRAGDAGFAALREGARTAGGQRQRLRAALVTVEVMLSVILLITCGLLIRAVWRVQAIDPGFQPRHVITLRTALPRPKYDSPLRRTEFYRDVLADVRALPGVDGAAFTSGLPMVVTGLVTSVDVPGQDPQTARRNPVSHRWVTAGYFRTMGIPIVRGRDIEDTDTRDRQWVAVVSQSFADRYWPREDPIGKTFGHRGQTRTVVGIVGDVKVRGLERTSEPQIYLAAEQINDALPANFDPKDLVVRHTGDSEPIISAIRRIVTAADPEQPLSNVRTMDAVLAGDTAARRLQLQVLGVLAAVAIILSAVGIYGLLAYTVAQRSQEIAVRLALGAEPARVGRMVVGDGMRLALLAVVPGVLVAYLAARALRSLLFGIAPGDPATYAVAVGVALLMTFAGCLVPALRAVRVTPMSVLRAE